MSSLVYAEMRVAGCDADFRVNDIPVWRLQHREATFQAIPVHEFLVDGSNRLRITLVGNGTAPEAQASLAVTGYPEGARLGEKGGQPLGRVDLQTPDAAGQPVQSAESSFSSALPIRWSWQDLAAVDWASPAASAAVLQFLQEFSRRLQAGDAPWLAGALRPRMSEYCQAYNMDPALELAEMDARIARRRADPSFAVTPFAAGDLALRPCAGGRLVECLLKSGEPAIRWTDARVGPLGAWNLKLGVRQGTLQVYR
ncbi:MAG: hypothetical protein JWQ76_1152 [Ramlibacter sp.]|nr:hypothetical protein [Ramlibacter sp.]